VNEVTAHQDRGGVYVTQEALSPKLGGGWHTLYWRGLDSQHPGAAIWGGHPDQAARFPTVDAALDALAQLVTPYRVAPIQDALFGTPLGAPDHPPTPSTYPRVRR
jgi:hypothetical protein